MKCNYGCNKEAKYQLKNDKWCCESSSNKCSAMREKNKNGLKRAYKEGRKDCLQFDGKRGWRKGKNAITDIRIKSKYKNPESVLKEDTYFTGTQKRAFKLITPYKCEKCGNKGKWKSEELILHIHHKDGNRRNNTKENLIYLCPNCHSQTDNFCFKGRKHKKHIDKV